MLPPIKKRASADAGLPCSNVAALPLVVLDHDEVIAERLTAAVGDESPDQFMIELLKAVKASGVAQVAEASGLRRKVFTGRSRRERTRALKRFGLSYAP